jgi:hypothetical protein
VKLPESDAMLFCLSTLGYGGSDITIRHSSSQILLKLDGEHGVRFLSFSPISPFEKFDSENGYDTSQISIIQHVHCFVLVFIIVFSILG